MIRKLSALAAALLLAASPLAAQAQNVTPAGAGLGVNTFNAAQTVPNSGLVMTGSSTGVTTLTSANAGASNFTLTLPALTDTLATIGANNNFTAAQTYTANSDFLVPNHYLIGTPQSDTTHATTAASGTGATATVTATGLGTCPVGAPVSITGVTPSGFNGNFLVTASSAGSVSYASAATGPQTVAGTAACDPLPFLFLRPAAQAISTGLWHGGTWIGWDNPSNNPTYAIFGMNNGSAQFTVTTAGAVFAGASVNTALYQVSGALLCSSTAPTIANGAGLGTVGTITGNSCSFDVTAGTGAASTFTITLPTASHTWTCNGSDITTQSSTVFVLKQAGTGTTTTAVMGMYNTSGALAAVGTADHLRIACQAG